MILLVLVLTFILGVYFERSSLIKYKRGIIVRRLIRGIRKASTVGGNVKFKKGFSRVVIIRLKVLIFKVPFPFNPEFDSNYII